MLAVDFDREVADLAPPDRVRGLREPERRARIIVEAAGAGGLGALVRAMPHMLFPLDDPPDYEPPPESSVATVAARTGRSVDDVFYDLLLQRDGEQLVLFTLGVLVFYGIDALPSALRRNMPGIDLPFGYISLAVPVGAGISALFAIEAWWKLVRNPDPDVDPLPSKVLFQSDEDVLVKGEV